MKSHPHAHAHSHGRAQARVHAHPHAHPHTTTPSTHRPLHRVLLTALLITLSYAAVEAAGGWWSGSLTLLSDAGHMVSDSFALALAFFAAWIAGRPPSQQHTYGYGRAEVLAAWISSLLLLVVVVVIFVEAIERLHRPRGVDGGMVMVIAGAGLLVNMTVAGIISRGQRTLNTRAALLHVLSDMLGSVAALISGAVIYFKHWVLIDPILSIFVCVLILFSTLSLLRESLLVLMEGVPPHLDIAEVGKAMAGVPRVSGIHDLHIWTLSSGTALLSAHVDIDELAHWEAILVDLHTLLAERFGIEHATLQPEVPARVY